VAAIPARKGEKALPRERILRTQDSVVARLNARKPLLPFKARNRDEWIQWRRAFRRALVRELGPMPERVPLRPEVLERADEGDYLREKVVFDSEQFMSVVAWVLVPKGLKRGERRPGILCAHGHGVGKDGLVGVADCAYQKNFAITLARRGYVAIAPDWRCFGERTDSDAWVRRPSRDGCNVAYLAMGYFGFHMLALQVWDGMRTLDYLSSRKEVDAKRIGCIGCSFGGTMTTYLSALEPRIKASVICCYISTLRDAFTRGLGNFCGVQYMPGLAKYGDIPEVAMLIAPKPLQVQVGEQDQCFVREDAVPAAKRLKRAYSVAGAGDRFDLDIFPGGHEIDPDRAIAFFDRWLDQSGR
jgi:dienelactone hydrolase